jgi:hypothetical protein
MVSLRARVHLHWPRALPASGSLVQLKQSHPQRPRRWVPGLGASDETRRGGGSQEKGGRVIDVESGARA